jgi:glycosyltransferase involved in cell wall biosynthesis
MNIGILVAALSADRMVGGAEMQACEVARQLASAHDVTVLTRSTRIPPALTALQRCRVVTRCRVRIPVLRFGADILMTLLWIRREGRSIDAIIAYQTVIDGLLGVLAKRLCGIPVIVSIQSEREYRTDRDVLNRSLSAFVFRHADRIAVQSPTIARELLSVAAAAPAAAGEVSASRVCIIPNGISVPRGVEGERNILLYVGRLVKVKGVRVLIEAMRHCPAQRLVIVGDGPEMKRLRRDAAGLSNVEFAGWVSHEGVDTYMTRATMLILPSLRNEGCPNVIMEAMARGIPVIATRVAGVPDLVRDGETGILTDPGDANALAAHINALAGDVAMRRRLGENGLREVRKYVWANVSPLVERELTTLARQRQRVAGAS